MQKGNGFLSRLKLGTCFGQEIWVMWILLTSNSDIHLSLVELQHCNIYLEKNLVSLTFQTDKILKGCYWYKTSSGKSQLYCKLPSYSLISDQFEE